MGNSQKPDSTLCFNTKVLTLCGICLCVCTYVNVCTCGCSLRSQKLMLGVFLYQSAPSVSDTESVRTRSSQNDKVVWPTNPWNLPLSASEHWASRNMVRSLFYLFACLFYVGTGLPNPGSRAWLSSTLTTEPSSPQPLIQNGEMHI